MAKKREWKLNIWTGDHTLALNENTRIVRMRGGGLYCKEFWGDYSLDYPRRGPWCRSLQKAIDSEVAPLPGGGSPGRGAQLHLHTKEATR